MNKEDELRRVVHKIATGVLYPNRGGAIGKFTSQPEAEAVAVPTAPTAPTVPTVAPAKNSLQQAATEMTRRMMYGIERGVARDDKATLVALRDMNRKQRRAFLAQRRRVP